MRSMCSVTIYTCSLSMSFNSNWWFLTYQEIDAQLPAQPSFLLTVPHSITRDVLSTPDAWHHHPSPAVGVAQNQGFPRHRGIADLDGVTCSLENSERAIQTHSSYYSHGCFKLTSIAFMNIWNISFIIFIMGKMFCVGSVSE